MKRLGEAKMKDRRQLRGVGIPVRVAEMLIVIVKAILITGAILYFGRFFGLNVREAGGQSPCRDSRSVAAAGSAPEGRLWS